MNDQLSTGGGLAPPNPHNRDRVTHRLFFDPLDYLPSEELYAEWNRQAALGYAEAGIAVLPLTPKKTPRIGDWPNKSSASPDQVVAWWKQSPGSLVGIDCRKANIVVIDCDCHPGQPDGVDALRRIVGRDFISLGAPIIETGGGGMHLIFAQPPGTRLTNKRGRLPQGIDVRADGGYIVAAGSYRNDGSNWCHDPDTPDLIAAIAGRSLPQVPEVLLELIRGPFGQHEPFAGGEKNPGEGSVRTAEHRHHNTAQSELRAESEALADTPEGGRNNRLNAISFRMGRFIAAGYITREEVEAQLMAACQKNGLARESVTAVRATMKSGIHAGCQKPFQGHAQDTMWPPFGADDHANTFSDSDADGDPGHAARNAGAYRRGQAHEARSAPEIETVVASSLADKLLPKQEWLVENLIPAGNVTLLSGDGGAGKSLLALQLAAAVATGGSWLGFTLKAGSALFLSAEDEIDELHRRLVHIEPKLNRLSELVLIPLAGKDAVLAAPQLPSKLVQPTPLLQALERLVAHHSPALLILDTSADLFAGNENARVEVRTFISMLRALCLTYRVTIVLLSHPSQSGLASGDGSSGSTSWNNSVRSRLYMARVRSEGGVEGDPDLRTLELKKSNRGRLGAKITLRYKDGMFIRENKCSANDRDAAQHAEEIFFKLLALYTKKNRSVSERPGSNYAPHVFSKDPASKGVPKRQLEAAMNRLFTEDKIDVEETGPPSRRVRRIVVVTPGHDKQPPEPTEEATNVADDS